VLNHENLINLNLYNKFFLKEIEKVLIIYFILNGIKFMQYVLHIVIAVSWSTLERSLI